MTPVDELMPYRFGQDLPEPFRNKYFDIANEKYRKSNASNHKHPNKPRTVKPRPKHYVASKYGLLDAEDGYEITMSYTEYQKARRDAETLRTWARYKKDLTITVKHTGMIVTVMLQKP
jgi:hypothetical protein